MDQAIIVPGTRRHHGVLGEKVVCQCGKRNEKVKTPWKICAVGTVHAPQGEYRRVGENSPFVHSQDMERFALELRETLSQTCACGADLEDWRLPGIEYTKTSFALARMTNITVTDADFSFASFAESSLQAANFHNCDLRGADFRGAWLRGVHFMSCDLSETTGFDKALEMEHARFIGTRLSSPVLKLARQKGSSLS